MQEQEKEKAGPRHPLPAIRTTTDDLSKAPTRSRTDPHAPVQEHQHRHHHDKLHLHRRLHSNSLRNRAFTGSKDHGYRHAARETVQSAIELRPPISFDALLRRDKKSPNSSNRDSNSHTHSHHAQHHRQQQPQKDVSDWAAQQAQASRQRISTQQDVEQAKRDNEKREKELRNSLKNVEDMAMSNTRHLDDTYYAILDKASLLRDAVANLQQLAEESQRLHSTFREETEQLHKSTTETLDSFENFDAHEKTVNELVTRLTRSRDRTQQLNGRLEEARNRVEAFETREKERQKTRRIRFGVAWSTLASIIVVILAVWIAKRRAAVGTRIHDVAKVLDGIGKDVIEIASPALQMLRPTSNLREDAYLNKLFDDL